MRKQTTHWTKEKCQEITIKCKNKREFSIINKSAYNKSLKNGWLNEICSHMIPQQKPSGYWTLKKCKDVALSYKTKTDFYNNHKGLYSKCFKNGWLDEICSHMKILGNRHNRCIYSYLFNDGYVYIGLTYNLSKRQQNRDCIITDSVTKHKLNTNTIPVRKQLTAYINVTDAVYLEGFYLKIYKLLGYKILNKMKTGNVGGHLLKWTKEKCYEEALKYNNKTDFIKNGKGAYSSASNNGWVDEICSHMVKYIHKSKYNTKEDCHKEALKYNRRMDFTKNKQGAYIISLKNGWLDEICSHMDEIKKPKGYWTKDNCQQEALKYNIRKNFMKKSRGAHKSAYNNGWLDEICSHMKKI